MLEHTFSVLEKGMSAGWGKNMAQIEYNSIDWELAQNLRYNTAVFAAFKQNKEIQDAWKLLTDENGKPRTWKEFYTEARKQSEQYNRVWLQTEFNQASHSAMTAREWHEFEKNKDLYPNLKYVTAGDERVRDSHAALDGKIYPIDHQFWNQYYPPNGWGCRCTVEATDEQPDEELPADLPVMPEYFKNNPGKTAKIFGDNHPYFNTEKSKEVLAFVRRLIKPADEVTKLFNLYNSYGNNYKKLYFNGNNGGFMVAHTEHHFDKIGGKYEKFVAKKLAENGSTVEFMAENAANKIDLKVDGNLFEIKGTKARSSKAIKSAILNARNKGAEDVILYMEKDFDFEAARKGIGRALGVANTIPNIWYLNDDQVLVNLYKKSRP